MKCLGQEAVLIYQDRDCFLGIISSGSRGRTLSPVEQTMSRSRRRTGYEKLFKKTGICLVQRPEDVLKIITQTAERGKPETSNTLMIAYIGKDNVIIKTHAIAAGVETRMKRETMILRKEDNKNSEGAPYMAVAWCFAATGNDELQCTQNIPNLEWDEDTTKNTEIQFHEKGDDQVLFKKVFTQYIKFKESVQVLKDLQTEERTRKTFEQRGEMQTKIKNMPL